MTNQNKTHGVLTEAQISEVWRKTPPQRDAISIAVWFARAIEAAVLAKAAPQSPVAPAYDDAAELIVRDVCELDPANPDLNDTVCVDVSDLLIIAKRHTEGRARLADAPAVSATPFERRESLFNSYIEQIHGTPPPTVNERGPDAFSAILRDLAEHALQVNDHTPKSFNSGVMALADRARKALKAAPTPPTSAADAERLDWLQKHDGRFYNKDRISSIVGVGFLIAGDRTGTRYQSVRDAIDAAIAANKESGDE